MRTLNVAILGQGRSGWSIHGAHFLRGDPRFRVAFVADALPERRDKAARAFGCPTDADWRAVLERKDIDLVVNALPSKYHCPVTTALLDAGKNVLSEKPGAATPEQIDEMDAAARAAGKTLAFFQQSRFAPYFVRIKELLASGRFGRTVQISVAFDGFQRRWDWQTLQSCVAGSLYNTGPHPLDQALDLLDGGVTPFVLCKMDRVNTFGDAEDFVRVLLTAPNAPLIDLQISSCNAFPSGTYNIQCANGGIWSDQKQVKWRWFDPSEAPAQKLTRESLTAPDGEPAYCVEKLDWHEGKWEAKAEENSFVPAVAALYDNLYKHLTEGAPLVVTTAQVRRQIAVIRACHAQNPFPRIDE